MRSRSLARSKEADKETGDSSKETQQERRQRKQTGAEQKREGMKERQIDRQRDKEGHMRRQETALTCTNVNPGIEVSEGVSNRPHCSRQNHAVYTQWLLLAAAAATALLLLLPLLMSLRSSPNRMAPDVVPHKNIQLCHS